MASSPDRTTDLDPLCERVACADRAPSFAERQFNLALLESMSDGVVACDADGVLALFNRAARQWHGTDPLRLPPEEWPRHYDLFQADGVTPLAAEDVPLARAFRGETVVDAGMAIAARGRPVRFVLANGSLITDDEGRKLGAVVVMRDVTELRRAEAELRQANDLLELRVAERTAQHQAQFATLRSILDSLDAPIFSVDRACRYTSFNARHAQVMAALYGVEIAVGDSLLDHVPDVAERDDLRRDLERALAGDSFVREALSGIDPRTHRYLQFAHHPVRDASGAVIGAVVMASDFTERRRMEEALREREDRYRSISDNVLDGLCLLDVTPDGGFRVVEINPALERLVGLARADALGHRCEDVLPGDIGRQVIVQCQRCAATAATSEEELVLDLPDGRRIIRWTLIPALRPDGRVARLIGIAHDITEHERASEERKSHLGFLEAMDRVNRAIQAAPTVEQMMSDVLDVALDVLNGDRAFLLHPCDPDAPSWRVPMECTRPEWPGALAAGESIPMEEHVAATLRTLRDVEGPVAFGPGYPYPVPRQRRRDSGSRGCSRWRSARASDNPGSSGSTVARACVSGRPRSSG